LSEIKERTLEIRQKISFGGCMALDEIGGRIGES
jgi:hypothetical protein